MEHFGELNLEFAHFCPVLRNFVGFLHNQVIEPLDFSGRRLEMSSDCIFIRLETDVPELHDFCIFGLDVFIVSFDLRFEQVDSLLAVY